MENLKEVIDQIMKERNYHKESFIYAYLDKTGANIQDLALFEQQTENGYKWFVAPKDSYGPVIQTPDD